MKTATDLLHQRFGRLLVTHRAENSKHGAARWGVLCDCGTVKTVRTDQLTQGSTVSCGCYAREAAGERVRTHGRTNTFEFSVWTAMKKRCTYEKHPRYHRYGGRGITICKRWEKFENFLEDMGECPFDNGSIERINNNKGYTPSNCKWLLKTEQSKNRNF
jgi:hypothetical protein